MQQIGMFLETFTLRITIWCRELCSSKKGNVCFWTKATIFPKYILEEYKLSRLSVKAKMKNWRTE